MIPIGIMENAKLAGDPFEALGDPHRRAIVELLFNNPRTVQEIADELPISRPAVSRHLRLLREAGLVSQESQGNRNLYKLDELGVKALQAYLEKVWGNLIARFKLAAENTEDTGATRERTDND